MKKEEYLKQLVKEKNIKVTQILSDHWIEFENANLHRVSRDMCESAVEAVHKALSCGDIKKGYTNFRCIKCDNQGEGIIGHTCKIRFCNR